MSRKPPVDLIATGERVCDLAVELGAEEAAAGVQYSIYTDLGQRDGLLEKSQESRSLSVMVELLVDERFSSHSTNDLRPEALRAFLQRAVDATRFLEPDPNRRLPEREKMGSADVAALDADDPSWPPPSATERREQLARLEGLCLEARGDAPVRSINAFLWDGRIDGCTVSSNGFAAGWARTSVGYGGSITMEDRDGRLPEAMAYYAARHGADLPPMEAVATELVERGRSRVGSGAVASGRYSMMLENRAAGRMLRVLTGPLSGTAVYEGRSCLADRMNQKIAPEGFSLTDDPLIPRAPGSRPHTGDGFPATSRPIIADGVLRSFFISLYNARRLEMDPTDASASNLVIAPGADSVDALLKGAGRCVRVEGFLGGNSSAITGDFSFGVVGTLFEDGEPVQPISEMNVSGNLFELLERWQASADDAWTYGAWRVPSLLFDDIQFSGL
ncbi:MAG: PmbA protein [Myxococcota bacterium]|jgi:PmbA protein